MFTHARKLIVGSALAGAAALALAVPALASPPAAEAPAADASAPYAVETFDYPNASQILEQKMIKLIRGDGNIVLADCDSSDKAQINVQVTRGPDEQDKPKLFCFRATAKSGFLTLEVPRVFYIETADHPVSAKLTTDAGDSQTVNVAKDDFESVGQGLGKPMTTLVELRVTG
ncbi:hypothetical protein ABT160_37720 [Streptomyces sp. NPDC001941]|uniref:hypothetical protein n=1 Tax=Streptomyces sp. NPDC001941 TaxID=3154659 RepID=UPI00331D128D